jgi:hypothetical protein
MPETRLWVVAALASALALPAQDDPRPTPQPPVEQRPVDQKKPAIPAMTDAAIDAAIAPLREVMASEAFAENPVRALSRPFYGFTGSILRGGQLNDEQEQRLVDFLGELREKAPGYAEWIDKAVFQVRNLTIGNVAPDIEGEDLDGVSFKLSDYAGKVVVLDFWGDW